MFLSYLKSAIRQIRRQRGYALINVLGLAMGIAVAALIFLYVQDELSFDRFHERGDRIYRVVFGSAEPGKQPDSWRVWHPMPLGPALASELAGVDRAVRLDDRNALLRRSSGSAAIERRLLFADEGFFSVFSFELLQGERALRDPGSIVLTESLAEAYFGAQENPVGQRVDVYLGSQFHTMTVTGIVADPPGNSSIRFDAVIPFPYLLTAYEWMRRQEQEWNSASFKTYVMLNPEAQADAVQASLQPLYNSKRPANLEREQPLQHRLQPMSRVHLDTSVRGGITPASDPRYSWILVGIALAILGIACINFTTLAIGRSVGRAREVGVRKAAGAARFQLVSQFWGEALVLAFLGLGGGVVLAEIVLPEFNAMAGKALAFDWFSRPTNVIAVLGITVAVGLTAGAYPALVLSGFRPVESLYKAPRVGRGRLTSILVVVQFSLSVFLLVGTTVMRGQLDYLQEFNLGYDRENLVIVDAQGQGATELMQRIQAELADRPEILGVTAMSNAFSRGWSRQGWDYRGETKYTYGFGVEHNVLEVLGIELVAGRTFDPARPADELESVVVNERFVEMMGWEDPVGEVIENFYEAPTVIGVFKDVNFRSLKNEVEPLVFVPHSDWPRGEVLVRVAQSQVAPALAELESVWKAVAPELPFRYVFQDEELAAQYASEQRWSRIVTWASGFAIFLACLGLLGLAALTVAGRTKEIGIRKVLGASVSGIAVRLSREFALLVIVATGIAVPAAWWAAERWLSGFVYRIGLGPGVFVFAGLAVLVLAMLTVGTQSVRAASADPIKSLRYE